MKKYSILFVIVCFLLIGCSSGKKLTCTREESNEVGKNKEIVTFTFKDKKINNYKSITTIELKNKDFAEQIVQSLNLEKDSMEAYGLKHEINTEDNIITITVEGTGKDIKKAAIENENSEFVDTNKGIADYKKEMKKSGYTCK